MQWLHSLKALLLCLCRLPVQPAVQRRRLPLRFLQLLGSRTSRPPRGTLRQRFHCRLPHIACISIRWTATGGAAAAGRLLLWLAGSVLPPPLSLLLSPLSPCGLAHQRQRSGTRPAVPPQRYPVLLVQP